MKLLISLVLFLFVSFNELCFAKQKKHVFNPKIERKVNIWKCNDYYYRKLSNGRKIKDCNYQVNGYEYIYIYPNNIDDMILDYSGFGGVFQKPSDEIKAEIEKEIYMIQELPFSIDYHTFFGRQNGKKLQITSRTLCNEKYNCYKNISFNIGSCFDLWKYDPELPRVQNIDKKNGEYRYVKVSENVNISQLQIECNKIVKKVLKKTGRLY